MTIEEEHRQIIEDALAAGEDVPLRVLAEYPDLLAVQLSQLAPGIRLVADGDVRLSATSPIADAAIEQGLHAGIAISQAVRDKVLEAVKKKWGD